MIKQKKAFTLVELLAVIVLLGIIMLLSFPKIIESINSQTAKIDKAKLNLMYSATKSYLYDHINQYPARGGNTYCISMDSLNNGDYLSFDDDELDSNYVVKVSYFADNDFEMSYVTSQSCMDKGVVNSELAGLNCKVAKVGYAVSNSITVTYPTPKGSSTFKYEYSLDEGQNWTIVSSFEEGSKITLNFNKEGSVLARVTNETDGSSQTCSAYVEQIDPTPVGTVVAFAGKKVPTGYLLANGTVVSKEKYPELYNVIRDSYGSADSVNFYLPDLKGRLVVGSNSNDSSFHHATAGGEKAHALTTDEMASHKHTFTGTATKTQAGGSHQHPVSGTTGNNTSIRGVFTTLTLDKDNYMLDQLSEFDSSTPYDSLSSGSEIGNTRYNVIEEHGHNISATTGDNNQSHTHEYSASGTLSKTGAGSTHENMMPYIAIQYIIKYQ